MYLNVVNYCKRMSVLVERTGLAGSDWAGKDWVSCLSCGLVWRQSEPTRESGSLFSGRAGLDWLRLTPDGSPFLYFLGLSVPD